METGSSGGFRVDGSSNRPDAGEGELLMQWPKAARHSRWPIRAARVGETFDWLVDEGEGCGPVAGAAVRKEAAGYATGSGRE